MSGYSWQTLWFARTQRCCASSWQRQDDSQQRVRKRASMIAPFSILHASVSALAHATVLCTSQILMSYSQVLPKPMFVHASSTLLYGLHCQNCDRDAWYTNLRHFGTSHLAQRQVCCRLFAFCNRCSEDQLLLRKGYFCTPVQGQG